MKSDLPLAADDGWDMSPRRESSVRVDMPTSFEPLSPERPLPSARGVLSAAEIEALLRPDLSDLPDLARLYHLFRQKPLFRKVRMLKTEFSTWKVKRFLNQKS